MFYRLTQEERMLQKKMVLTLYHDLESFLKSEDFENDLKENLEISHPNYLKNLERRKKDMQKSDHAIVVAGMQASCVDMFIFKRIV